MKLSLTNKCAHRQHGLIEANSGIPHQAHTYTELRQQIHDDLRIQYPEWVQPNGESPLCDAYEARLMELLDPSRKKADNESVGTPSSTFEHGLN
jgi:hypothetical protein